MPTALYVRNRREASLVARIAREFGKKATVQDIMSNDRFLLHIADRLFGADPEDKIKFIMEARDAVKEFRRLRELRYII